MEVYLIIKYRVHTVQNVGKIEITTFSIIKSYDHILKANEKDDL